MRSQQIVELISKPPSGMTKGALSYTLGRPNVSGPERPTAAQRKFAEDYQAMPTPEVRTHVHPAHTVSSAPRRPKGPLTPVELAWLNRFPAPVDPAAVTFNDAQALAQMDATISPLEHPADSRLLRSVWSPVLEHHDGKSADVAMENAKRPLPDLPASTVAALADALAAEIPALTREEAVGRAGAMVRDAAAKRAQARQAAIDAADEQQMRVSGHTYSRTAVNL